jgi:UTP--glucose-1-phosphate uridylyltransferase
MIKQAIIPLAGLGTRMLPLSSVMAKELLPINGKPNIEYIMEECLEACRKMKTKISCLIIY